MQKYDGDAAEKLRGDPEENSKRKKNRVPQRIEKVHRTEMG